MPGPILDPSHELAERLKGVEAAAFTGGDLSPYMEAPSGMYIPGAWMNIPSGTCSGSVGAAVNVIEFYPVYVPVAVTAVSVSVNVTTAQSGWNGLHCGFYSGNLTGYTLVQDFGSFNVSTTGQKVITGSWNIPKGWMWAAARLEGTGTTAPSMSRVDTYVPITPILGATYNNVGSDVYGHVTTAIAPDLASGGLPASITPADAMFWSPLQFSIQVQ